VLFSKSARRYFTQIVRRGQHPMPVRHVPQSAQVCSSASAGLACVRETPFHHFAALAADASPLLPAKSLAVVVERATLRRMFVGPTTALLLALGNVRPHALFFALCGHRLVVSHLRTADGDQAKHVLPILRMLARRLRQAWPQVKIVVRADSGLCRPLMFDWCEKNDVSYVLGLKTNAILTRLAADTLRAAAERFAVRREACRVFGEFRYAAGTWSCERRVVVKGEHIPDAKKPAEGKANPRYLVTNLPHPAQELYEDVYCARGEMENRIKEQQMMLFSDRTSCHEFDANAFRLLLSSVAYVLFEHMRRTCLVGTELETAQVSTIRNRLLKIGASVIVSVRRVHLRLSGAFPLRTLFASVLRRLAAPAVPAAIPSG